jgi:hypothetical protein
MWLLANDPELMDPGGLPMGERAKKLARNKHSPGLMDPGLRTTGPLAPETPGSSPFPLGNDYPGPGDRLEGEKLNPVSPAPRDRASRKFFSRHRPGRQRARTTVTKSSRRRPFTAETKLAQTHRNPQKTGSFCASERY